MKFDLVDRRCVVTGASRGIGKEIARNLAYFGATVIMACRDRERGSAALHDIVTDSGNDRVSLMPLDLASRASIESFVRNVTAGGSPLHVLVNNAGCFCPTRQLSPEGIELTWATNVLGPFRLTNLLLPALLRSGPSRVVYLASKVAGDLDLDDVEFIRRPYTGTAAYRQAQQANRLLACHLGAQLGPKLSVHACHPGVVASDLYRDERGWGAAWRTLTRWVAGSPRWGALTPTLVAADPSIQGIHGRLWVNRRPRACRFARDLAEQKIAWTRCAEQSGCNGL